MGVVTQNIDSMHQKGGVSEGKVIELHGDMRRVICSDNKTPLNALPFRSGGCCFTCTWEDLESGAIDGHSGVPICPQCGAPLRTETVFFGQPLASRVMDSATEAVASADILFIIGSTLIVEPANNLPLEALCRGTPVVIINFDETKYDEYATGLVRQKAGAFLEEVAKHLDLSPQLQLNDDQSTGVPGVVVPPVLSEESPEEKKLVRVLEEALQRNVEMSTRGSAFFCTCIDEANAEEELMARSMQAMNAVSHCGEGTGHVPKMLFSATSEKLALLAYVPEACHEQLDMSEWVEHVLGILGGDDTCPITVVDHQLVRAEIKGDSAKDVNPMKLQTVGINEAVQYLRRKGLIDDDEDDDDECLPSLDHF